MAGIPYEIITAAGAQRRAIPDDFKYNPKKLKHLKNILHNVSVALGTLSSSMNEFSKLKGPEISPDGMLGGVGYIIPIQDIKQTFATSVHSLSNIADCIADELTNPRWNAKEDKEIKELIKEKDEAQDEVEDAGNPDDMDINPEDVVNPDESEKEPESEPEPAEGVSEPVVSDFDEPIKMAVRRSLISSMKTK